MKTARLRHAAPRLTRFDRALICVGSLGLALPSSIASAQAIYRCETRGVVIYADRPCAADAAVHESDGRRVTVYPAPPISRSASSQRTSSERASNSKSVNKRAAAALAKRQASCAKLDRSLREVRSKLRSGYGVKEGERLKARQRQLGERRRTEKCR